MLETFTVAVFPHPTIELLNCSENNVHRPSKEGPDHPARHYGTTSSRLTREAAQLPVHPSHCHQLRSFGHSQASHVRHTLDRAGSVQAIFHARFSVYYSKAAAAARAIMARRHVAACRSPPPRYGHSNWFRAASHPEDFGHKC